MNDEEYLGICDSCELETLVKDQDGLLICEDCFIDNIKEE